ncbi:hypothetical protein Tco_0749986 [Tanacetum coccineum]|uniref:Uncharacterized protein n=1 Tax=Tanacetum coccineum TaxID=301880 RepID=A0ABQ4Z072_9ASTR
MYNRKEQYGRVKIVVKKLSERQLQIQRASSREFNHRFTMFRRLKKQWDLYQMKRLDKKKIEAHSKLHGKDSGCKVSTCESCSMIRIGTGQIHDENDVFANDKTILEVTCFIHELKRSDDDWSFQQCVPLGEHRKQKPFLKFNDLQCPTCKKCLYSANHDECVLEYLSRLQNPSATAQNKDAKLPLRQQREICHRKAPFLNDKMMSVHISSGLAPQRQEMSVENVSSGLVLKDKWRQLMTTLTPFAPKTNVVPTAEKRLIRHNKGF